MRRFNLNEFLWFIILSLFMMIIAYGIASGNIYNILTQRLVKFLWIAVVIIGLLILVQIPKIFTIPDRTGVKKSNAIFILALSIMFIGVMQAPIVTLSKQVQVVVQDENHQHDEEEHIPDGVINVTDKNFYGYLEEIQKDLDKFENRDIYLKGRVIKQGEKYIITKNVMNCCAADAKTYGIFIDIRPTMNLEEGREYVIAGKLQKIEVKHNNKYIELPEIKDVKLVTKL